MEGDSFVDESGDFTKSTLNLVGGCMLPHQAVQARLANVWYQQVTNRTTAAICNSFRYRRL